MGWLYKAGVTVTFSFLFPGLSDGEFLSSLKFQDHPYLTSLSPFQNNRRQEEGLLPLPVMMGSVNTAEGTGIAAYLDCSAEKPGHGS